MVIRIKRTNKTRWVITSLYNERETAVLVERPSGNRLFLISAEQHAVRAVNWNRYNCDFNAKLCARYSYFIYCCLYTRYCTRDRVYINKKKYICLNIKKPTCSLYYKIYVLVFCTYYILLRRRRRWTRIHSYNIHTRLVQENKVKWIEKSYFPSYFSSPVLRLYEHTWPFSLRLNSHTMIF